MNRCSRSVLLDNYDTIFVEDLDILGMVIDSPSGSFTIVVTWQVIGRANRNLIATLGRTVEEML